MPYRQLFPKISWLLIETLLILLCGLLEQPGFTLIFFFINYLFFHLEVTTIIQIAKIAHISTII